MTRRLGCVAAAVLLARCQAEAAAAGGGAIPNPSYHHHVSTETSVETLAVVPGSGWFHFIEVDGREPRAVYASDSSLHVVRRLDVATDSFEVLAGQEGVPGFFDGPANHSLLNRPASLCRMPHGHLAVVDAGNACIRTISPETGEVVTLAGNCCGRPGFADGPAGEARFSGTMKSIACLANCSLLVGDLGTGRLRLIQVRDPERTAAAGPKRSSLPPMVLWGFTGLAGAALLLVAGLAGKRWADSRAAAAARRMAEVRAVHAVESNIAEARQAQVAAGWLFHLRHPMHRKPTLGAEAAEARGPLLLEEEAGHPSEGAACSGQPQPSAAGQGQERSTVDGEDLERGAAEPLQAQARECAGNLHGGPTDAGASSSTVGQPASAGGGARWAPTQQLFAYLSPLRRT